MRIVYDIYYLIITSTVIFYLDKNLHQSIINYNNILIAIYSGIEDNHTIILITFFSYNYTSLLLIIFYFFFFIYLYVCRNFHY